MSKVCLQQYHFRFVAAETLHEGCGGAGCLVESGAAGGADIRTQGDFGGQAPNQVCICFCICIHLHKIFFSESESLSLRLLVIVVE